MLNAKFCIKTEMRNNKKKCLVYVNFPTWSLHDLKEINRTQSIAS